jgi:hypothetical protein
MPTQQRREVGVGDGRFAPRQEADLARHFMRTNNVLEADRARDFRQANFVIGPDMRVHANDREGESALFSRRRQDAARMFEIHGFDHFPGRRATARGFEPPSLQTHRTLDFKHK